MITLRLAYILPALADFWLAASTLGQITIGTNDALLPQSQFAAVASCWGLFLLIGLIRPVERAWILLPTALVITLIGCAFLAAYIGGAIPLWRTTLAAVVVVALAALSFHGWRLARRLGGNDTA